MGASQASCARDQQVNPVERDRLTDLLERRSASQREWLDQFEEAVSDEVWDPGSSRDLGLGLLVNLVTRSTVDGRHLFGDPLSEPFFYARFFRPWVQNALRDKSQSDHIRNEQLKGVIG